MKLAKLILTSMENNPRDWEPERYDLSLINKFCNWRISLKVPRRLCYCYVKPIDGGALSGVRLSWLQSRKVRKAISRMSNAKLEWSQVEIKQPQLTTVYPQAKSDVKG